LRERCEEFRRQLEMEVLFGQKSDTPGNAEKELVGCNPPHVLEPIERNETCDAVLLEEPCSSGQLRALPDARGTSDEHGPTISEDPVRDLIACGVRPRNVFVGPGM